MPRIPHLAALTQPDPGIVSAGALVPRGGLHQSRDINDLGKGGSMDRSTRSLRFPGKVSHRRADFPAGAPIRRGPLPGQVRDSSPRARDLEDYAQLLRNRGPDPPRPYKLAARFGTISQTLRTVVSGPSQAVIIYRSTIPRTCSLARQTFPCSADSSLPLAMLCILIAVSVGSTIDRR